MPIPKLFILLTAYNCEKTIERAIFSVLPQLSESIRLLIINDGSTDTTKEKIFKTIAEKEFIEYIEQPNSWVSRALLFWINHLIENGEGESYFSRLDSDDEYTPDGALKIFSYIEKNPWFEVYTFSLLNSDTTDLSKIDKEWFFTYKQLSESPAGSFIDCTCWVAKINKIAQKKYSFAEVPARFWDGIPLMRLQKDFGSMVAKIPFYIVHQTPNSLSRRTISYPYSKIAIEVNKLLIDEFYFENREFQKKKYWDACLILARYLWMNKSYKEGYAYFIEGIKYSSQNILSIWVALVCSIPGGYNIVNFLVEKFLFKKI